MTATTYTELKPNVSSNRGILKAKPDFIREILGQPAKLDPDSVLRYCAIIELCNMSRLGAISQVLISELAQTHLEFNCIVVPGSDGRLEKGPVLSDDISATELMIITQFPELVPELIDQIVQLEKNRILPQLDPDFEWKNPRDTTMLLSAFNNNPAHSWPDRVLDSKVVAGKKALHLEGVDQVHQEWQNSSIRKSVQNYLNQFLTTTKTGFSRGVQCFNVDTGEIFYKPESNALGLKYGPIRALQVFLTRYCLQHGLVPRETNTLKKLETLFPDEVAVAHAYATALRIYHWQQNQHFLGKDATVRLQTRELIGIIGPIEQFITTQKALEKRSTQE